MHLLLNLDTTPRSDDDGPEQSNFKHLNCNHSNYSSQLHYKNIDIKLLLQVDKGLEKPSIVYNKNHSTF